MQAFFIRRIVIFLGAFCQLGLVCALAQEQPLPAPFKIVMVLPRPEQNIEQAFRDYLQRQQLAANIQVVQFSGLPEDAGALVSRVHALQPDLIYSWGTTTTLALAGQAQDAQGPSIHETPIVFTEVTDPIGAGLLAQLDPPGRNLTGVIHVAPVDIQLNALLAYRPFKRIAYIVNPAEPNTLSIAQRLQQLEEKMGFELLEATIPLDAAGHPDAAALPSLIGGLSAQGADVLYIGPSTFLAFTHRDLVTRAALEQRLPTFCTTESVVRESYCMFSLFSNGANVGRFAAFKAVEILAGRKPVQQIPVETLQRFSLLINMPIVRSLELYPPISLLNVAEVIE